MRKYATVSCNDPKRPTIRLNIGGKLLQVLKVQPTALNLRGPLGSEHNGEFTVSKGTDLDITVIGATAQKKQVSVGEIREVEAGKSYAIEVYAPSALVPGMVRDALTVEAMCSDGKVRTTVIQVTIDHQAPITMIPRGNVVFQRRDTARLGSPGAAPVRRDLQLMGTDPKTPFTITGIEVMDAPEGLFKISQRTIQPGQRYVVSIEVTEQRKERSIRGQLKIKTDHPDMPEVAARIYAQFGAAAALPTPRPNPGTQNRPKQGSSPVKLDKRPIPQTKPVPAPKVKPAG
ncbi:MAG: hypothetical protein ACPHQT_08270 [Planctomycetota bacterium]